MEKISVETYTNRGRLRIRFRIGNGAGITESSAFYPEDNNIKSLANNLSYLADEINRDIERDVDRVRRNKIRLEGREFWIKLWSACRSIIHEKALDIMPKMIGRVSGHENISEWNGKGNPYRYLYFLIDGDEVIYIGQASSLSSRIRDHKKDKEFHRVLYSLHDADSIDSAEIAAIQGFNPKYNIQHKSASPPRFTLDDVVSRVWHNAINKNHPEVISCRPIRKYT